MLTILLGVLVFNINFAISNDCPTPVCKPSWTPKEYPDARSESGLCGRNCTNTWVCDPCHVLSNETADLLDKNIASIPTIEQTCIRTKIERTALALMTVNIVNRMEAGSFTSNARTFAETLRMRLDTLAGYECGNTVAIFFSREDRKIYTSVGPAANKILTSDCIQEIYEDARDNYMKKDQFGEGILYMIQQYKKALEDETCGDDKPWVVWVVIGVVGFVLGVVFFWFCCFGPCSSKGDGLHCGSGGNGGGGGDGSRGGGGGDSGGGGGDC